MAGLSGCGHAGKLVVDSPILPYQKPDISEITGIDDDDEAAALAGTKTSAAGAGSAGSAAPAGK